MYCYNIIFLTLLITFTNGQYNQQRNDDYDYNQQPQRATYQQPQFQNHQPQPAILMHKQQLTHDGGFNYVFAADNGLKQGESIAPDGTRTGAYQYVDPNGKTISVKYTAGKEGFKILEGDHIPKAPVPVQQAAPQPAYTPNPQYQAYTPQFSQYNSGNDDGQYRPDVYEKAQSAAYSGPQTFTSAAKYSAPKQVQYAANNVEEPDYNVAPGTPHTFGNGYAFEFAG